MYAFQPRSSLRTFVSAALFLLLSFLVIPAITNAPVCGAYRRPLRAA